MVFIRFERSARDVVSEGTGIKATRLSKRSEDQILNLRRRSGSSKYALSYLASPRRGRIRRAL